MKENILLDKSVDFAVRIVKLCNYLKNKNEHIMSNQILRSGTSIGANISEATYAQSKTDFISKMHISLKETSETEYWLKVLYKSKYINDEMFQSICADCIDIKKLLISSINTAKEIK